MDLKEIEKSFENMATMATNEEEEVGRVGEFLLLPFSSEYFVLLSAI
jgi:hypothetical protein